MFLLINQIGFVSTKLCRVFFRNLLKRFDVSNCKFTKVQDTKWFRFRQGYSNIIDKKCKFYYANLLLQKFQKPCYQSYFSREFNIEKYNWYNIYRCKITDIFDRYISEFNYKLLNNILSCNSLLCKFKIRDNENCMYCIHESENIKHLLFDCRNVQSLWYEMGILLNIRIQWKHLIIGFYIEKNDKTFFFNNFISFIAFKIYKYKMYCRIHNKTEDEIGLKCYIKNSLVILINVLKNLNQMENFNTIVENFFHKL